MKKINKILPLLAAVATTSAITPIIVSCSSNKEGMFDNETLRQFAFNVFTYLYTENIARQPEALEKINIVYRSYYQYLENEKSGQKCMGIATMAGTAMEAIARQPEAFDKVRSSLDLSFVRLDKDPEYMAIGIGIVTGQSVEGIARQPEAETKINLAKDITIDHTEQSTCFDEAGGIGIAGGQAAEGIARQPEAEGFIRGSLLTICIQCHKIYRNNKTVSMNASASYNLKSANESEDNTTSVSATSELVYALSNGKAVDVGVVGGQAVEAIARYPEGVQPINTALVELCDIIYEVDSIQKSRFCGDYGKDVVEAIARVLSTSTSYVVTSMLNATKAFHVPFVKANESRARLLESIVMLFGEGMGRTPANFQYQSIGPRATNLLYGAFNDIVNVDSDATASDITRLTINFLNEARWAEGGTEEAAFENYEKIEDQYIKTLNSLAGR